MKTKKRRFVVKVVYTYDGVEPGSANTFAFNTAAEKDAFIDGVKAGQQGDCRVDEE